MDFEASYTPAPKKNKWTNIYNKRPLSWIKGNQGMQLTELHILESSLQKIDFIHWHVTYMKLQQLKVTQQFGVQQ
jgi:hypothetical protein